MASTTEAFGAKLAIDSSAWEAGLKKASSASDAFQRGFKVAMDKASSAAVAVGEAAKTAALGIAAGAVAAATAAVGVTTSFANYADAVQKASDRTGVSTEQLTRWQHAAEMSGSSAESMEGHITKLQESAAKAAVSATGTYNEQAAAFDRLGVTTREYGDNMANQYGALKDNETITREVMNALAGVADTTERARLAVDLFGKSGTDILPMLAGGAAGLAQMEGEADKFGLTISRAAADDGAAFNDSISRLQASFKGITIALGSQLAPVLTNVFNTFADWVASNREFIGMALESLLSKISDAWNYITTAIGGADGASARLEAGWIVIAGAVEQVGYIGSQVFQTMQIAGLSVAKVLSQVWTTLLDTFAQRLETLAHYASYVSESAAAALRQGAFDVRTAAQDQRYTTSQYDTQIGQASANLVQTNEERNTAYQNRADQLDSANRRAEEAQRQAAANQAAADNSSAAAVAMENTASAMERLAAASKRTETAALAASNG